MTRRGAVLVFLLLCIALAGVPASAQTAATLERKWEQLPAERLLGRQVLVNLRTGASVEGKCLSITPDSLSLRTGQPGPAAEQRIDSSAVTRISMAQASKGRRIGLALAGALGGMAAAGLIVGRLREGSSANGQIAAVFGAGGAGAIGGYLAGAALDRRARKVIVVVP